MAPKLKRARFESLVFFFIYQIASPFIDPRPGALRRSRRPVEETEKQVPRKPAGHQVLGGRFPKGLRNLSHVGRSVKTEDA